MEWFFVLLVLAGLMASLAGALGGLLAPLGSIAGFVLARILVGKLTGEGLMWYLVSIPCLFVMLVSSALVSATTRDLRRRWWREKQAP